MFYVHEFRRSNRKRLSTLVTGIFLVSLLTPVISAQADGVTWRKVNPSCSCSYIASSSDGSKLIAAVSSGQILTSTNYGATWTPRDSVRYWGAVASSSDGNKLVGAVIEGQIYTRFKESSQHQLLVSRVDVR
jgi:hypothetical protein